MPDFSSSLWVGSQKKNKKYSTFLTFGKLFRALKSFFGISCLNVKKSDKSWCVNTAVLIIHLCCQNTLHAKKSTCKYFRLNPQRSTETTSLLLTVQQQRIRNSHPLWLLVSLGWPLIGPPTEGCWLISHLPPPLFLGTVLWCTSYQLQDMLTAKSVLFTLALAFGSDICSFPWAR